MGTWLWRSTGTHWRKWALEGDLGLWLLKCSERDQEAEVKCILGMPSPFQREWSSRPQCGQCVGKGLEADCRAASPPEFQSDSAWRQAEVSKMKSKI